MAAWSGFQIITPTSTTNPITLMAKADGKEFDCVISYSAWQIWKDWNARIFKNDHSSVTATIFKIHEDES